jgi:hypothetical protein
MLRWLVLACSIGLVAGCAKIQPLAPSAFDLAPAPTNGSADLLAPSDLAPEAADLKSDQDLGMKGAPDLAASPADLRVATSCSPVINELATGTSTSGLEEFVELANPCTVALDLTGWKLVYRAAASTNEGTLVADLAHTVPAGGFLVFAGSGYYTAVRDGTMASGLAAAGGGVGLRDPGGALVDSVGWGTATNAMVQGSAAPAPTDVAAPGRSIIRLPGAASSGDNAGDFKVTTDPTPHAANVLL